MTQPPKYHRLHPFLRFRGWVGRQSQLGPVAGRNEGKMSGWQSFFALVGFFTVMGWLADLAWGASLALRDLPLLQSPGIFTAFAYGLFGGAQ